MINTRKNCLTNVALMHPNYRNFYLSSDIGKIYLPIDSIIDFSLDYGSFSGRFALINNIEKKIIRRKERSER